MYAIRSYYAFNKAFKKRFGTSPGDYREKRLTEVPIYGTTLINRIMETINLKPTVKTLKPKQVIYVQSQGAYNESASKAWDKVCEFANVITSYSIHYTKLYDGQP